MARKLFSVTPREAIGIPIFIVRAISSVYTLSLFVSGEDFLELINIQYIRLAKIIGVVVFFLLGAGYGYVLGLFIRIRKQKEQVSNRRRIQLFPNFISRTLIGFILYLFLKVIKGLSGKKYTPGDPLRIKELGSILKDPTKAKIFWTIMGGTIFVLTVIILSIYIYFNHREKRRLKKNLQLKKES